RAAPREVVAHLRIGADLSAAARSDDLRDAVDWTALCARLRGRAAARPYKLAEALAAALADAALEDPRVAWIRLRLEKPGALPGVDSLSVCVFRERR
ncbi:MAG: dihydroneopterin aldolase, partial [Kiritimatiellae bacterium]|nr:dihydroneopterin aldolase [Kiritimatiellia bacterium]